MSETRMVRYLPVRVAGQDYLIAMDTVLAVQPIAGTEPSTFTVSPPPTGTAELNDSVDDAVPVVDLGVLLGDERRQLAHQYAVLVMTPAGSCALLVDAIRAIVSVGPDDVQAMPYLLTLTRCPFSAMINMEEEMLPVIDVTLLLEHLRTVRPDLVTEVNHGG